MSGFQIIVTGIFVTLILVGVAVFALFGGAFGGGSVGAVTIWGTLDEQRALYVIDSMRSVEKAIQDVTYIQKDEATYRSELLNAMASGRGPDLFLISQEDIGTFADKVSVIPYSSVSQGNFISAFIEEGQLFLTPQGALGLPFMVDPLVMYWNRDLFASAGESQPPQYWNDFLALAPKISSLNSISSVKTSAVALGEWQNISHAKAILSALFMQAGDRITARAANGALVPMLGQVQEFTAAGPAESALRFYTEFANPTKTTYSWNRSLPNSTDAFVGGQLAVYFGFASEYTTLAERNPNLRFGVGLLPQLQGNSTRMTYGSMLALAIPRTAQNPNGALVVAQILSGQTAARVLTIQSGMPSVRRDVPLDTSNNAVADVFAQSALIARGWIDPDRQGTDAIFRTMIESVVSGRAVPTQAVSQASQELGLLLPTIY